MKTIGSPAYKQAYAVAKSVPKRTATWPQQQQSAVKFLCQCWKKMLSTSK